MLDSIHRMLLEKKQDPKYARPETKNLAERKVVNQSGFFSIDLKCVDLGISENQLSLDDKNSSGR